MEKFVSLFQYMEPLGLCDDIKALVVANFATLQHMEPADCRPLKYVCLLWSVLFF